MKHHLLSCHNSQREKISFHIPELTTKMTKSQGPENVLVHIVNMNMKIKVIKVN
jgi:hypothetical protein